MLLSQNNHMVQALTLDGAHQLLRGRVLRESRESRSLRSACANVYSGGMAATLCSPLSCVVAFAQVSHLRGIVTPRTIPDSFAKGTCHRPASYRFNRGQRTHTVRASGFLYETLTIEIPAGLGSYVSCSGAGEDSERN